jgi:hypothetical protein
MMPAAPDLFPPLDDALRALDDFPGRPADVATARAFLEQLDQVRDVPAVVLDQAQAVLLEGAYQAGVRCADESGHVLVMSLPVFLELMAAKTIVSERTYVFDPLGWLARRPLVALAGSLALGALLAFLVDHQPEAGTWLLGAAVAAGALAVWRGALGPLVAPCPPNCPDCLPLHNINKRT